MKQGIDAIDGVIFDMDGLMLDTERPALAAWIKAAEQWGYTLEAQVVFRTIGINEPAMRAVYHAEYGAQFPYEAIRQKVRQILAQEQTIQHRPGLLILLDHLAALSLPLAVATSTGKESALKKLEKAGIIDRFSAFAFGDEVSHGKPAPDIFLCAAQRLNIEPVFCIGFEDSPPGLLGLYRAGIRSVFVKDLLEPPVEIAATIWHRYENLAEARELF
ncbi:MAG: HAD family phosphatase [Spirochaetaceae bacterium]|jgi:HAD superfamily hydrolase (TIGR01509 family)|nr:HAD family phosphatase [Spirochaetaceae bacterium]